jgi:hypothetical protein
MRWPREEDATKFYGDPCDADGQLSEGWYRSNIVYVVPPFAMLYAGKEVSRIACHRRCAVALHDALTLLTLYPNWDDGRTRLFGGSFNFRPKRRAVGLSMHAYGCAFDFDTMNNPMGPELTPTGFQPDSPMVRAFRSVGAEWGGDWRVRKDPMHFQFART